MYISMLINPLKLLLVLNLYYSVLRIKETEDRILSKD